MQSISQDYSIWNGCCITIMNYWVWALEPKNQAKRCFYRNFIPIYLIIHVYMMILNLWWCRSPPQILFLIPHPLLLKLYRSVLTLIHRSLSRIISLADRISLLPVLIFWLVSLFFTMIILLVLVICVSCWMIYSVILVLWDLHRYTITIISLHVLLVRCILMKELWRWTLSSDKSYSRGSRRWGVGFLRRGGSGLGWGGLRGWLDYLRVRSHFET